MEAPTSNDIISRLPFELCNQIASALPTCTDILSVAQTSRRNYHAFNHCAYERAASFPLPCLLIHWAAFRGSTRVIEAAHHAGIDIDKDPNHGYPAIQKLWHTETLFLMELDEQQRDQWKDQVLYHDADGNVDSGAPVYGRPMHVAARAGHVDVVQQLLQYGAKLDSASAGLCPCSAPEMRLELGNYDGPIALAPDIWLQAWTPLHVALCAGQGQVAKFILAQDSASAAVSMKPTVKSTMLHAACVAGDLEVVQWLDRSGLVEDVNAKDWTGNSPLGYAYLRGHHKCVRYLLSMGADPNHKVYKTKTYTEEMEATLLGDAVMHGRFKDALQLLDLGSIEDPGKAMHQLSHYRWDRSRWSLCNAHFQAGHIERGRKILASLMSSVPQDELSGLLDSNLHVATQKFNLPAMEALVQAGADVNTSISDRTPLHMAIMLAPRMAIEEESRVLSVVRWLLAQGACPNTVIGTEQPPLWLLSRYYVYWSSLTLKWSLEEALLEYGARPHRGTSGNYDQLVYPSTLEYAMHSQNVTRLHDLVAMCGGASALGKDDLLGLRHVAKESLGGSPSMLKFVRELDLEGVLDEVPYVALTRIQEPRIMG